MGPPVPPAPPLSQTPWPLRRNHRRHSWIRPLPEEWKPVMIRPLTLPPPPLPCLSQSHPMPGKPSASCSRDTGTAHAPLGLLHQVLGVRALTLMSVIYKLLYNVLCSPYLGLRLGLLLWRRCWRPWWSPRALCWMPLTPFTPWPELQHSADQNTTSAAEEMQKVGASPSQTRCLSFSL